jgi:hypothetical protein
MSPNTTPIAPRVSAATRLEWAGEAEESVPYIVNGSGGMMRHRQL